MITKENFRLGEEKYEHYLKSSEELKSEIEKYNDILVSLDLRVGDEVYILTFIDHMIMPGVN